MAKRLFDVISAFTALVMLAPIFGIAFVGIRLSSRGPAIYRARRVGRGGAVFVMYKFRTMHVGSAGGGVITGPNDSRVFLLGRILRVLKIDELPQLFNVLAGDMSIVGPRPEDPEIVEKYYGAIGQESLTVVPGLASPGSIYNYTHGQLFLDDANPEESYVCRLLPVKLALEAVYVRHRSFVGDLKIIGRTLAAILWIAAGRMAFSDPPEMLEAQAMLQDCLGNAR